MGDDGAASDDRRGDSGAKPRQTERLAKRVKNRMVQMANEFMGAAGAVLI